MLSGFQATKFRYLFHLLDINDDGLIEKKDFTELAERLSTFQNGLIDDKAYEKLVFRGTTFYNRLMKALKPSDPTRIGLHEWIRYIHEEILVSGDEDNLAELTQLLLGFVFGLFDENHDGYLSLEEYQDLFQTLNVSRSKSLETFRKLDVNEDHTLSRYEVVLAVETFLISDDPKDSGNWIFGDYDA